MFGSSFGKYVLIVARITWKNWSNFVLITYLKNGFVLSASIKSMFVNSEVFGSLFG